MLRLGNRHAVARHDQHFVGKRHHDADVGRFDRLHTAGDIAGFAHHLVTESGEEDVGKRAIHCFGHQLCQERTGRADDCTRNDHRGVLQYEAFKGDSKAGQGVVKRNDDRHVGAADR